MYQVLFHYLGCRRERQTSFLSRGTFILGLGEKPSKRLQIVMSGQEIKQNDRLVLNRVTVGELSEKGIFELNLD